MGSFCCASFLFFDLSITNEIFQGQPHVLPPIQQQPDRRRDQDRRRSQAGNVVPPSPALVRHGSKGRRGPGGSPGGPNSPQYSGQPGTPQMGSNRLSNNPQQHPYTNAAGVYDYATPTDDPYRQQQTYHGASPMLPSAGPVSPAVSNARSRAGEAGVSQQGDFNQQQIHEEPPKPSLLRILTCRC